MASRQNSSGLSEKPKRPPAKTPESREKQMIALAFDVAEERLRNGTASAAEITHFLKLGTIREEMEREQLEHKNLLIRAQIESYETNKTIEELYRKALSAMKEYSGRAEDEDEFI